jgi:hypothetical protein
LEDYKNSFEQHEKTGNWCSYCPVALAVKRALNINNVGVGSMHVYLFYLKENEVKLNLPLAATQFINEVDDIPYRANTLPKIDPKINFPFIFALEIPDDLVKEV